MNIRLVTVTRPWISQGPASPPVAGSDQELVLMDFSCPAPPSPGPQPVCGQQTLTVLTACPGTRLGLVTPSATQFLC